MLLVLSCLSRFISPIMFQLPALLGIAFPVLLLINALWVGWWLVFGKKYALLSIVALIASSWNIRQHLSFNCAANEPKGDFSVMTFNVKVFDLYSWNHNSASKDSILALIFRANPDIICFQEFYTDNTNHFNILKKLNPVYPHHVFHRTLKMEPGQQWGIATFSKFPIAHSEPIAFPFARHNLSLLTDVVVRHDTVRVFNTHLQSIHLEKYEYEGLTKFESGREALRPFIGIYIKMKNAFKSRAHQSELLAEKINASPHRVLVCGDFNDTPNSYAYRTILSDKLNDSFKEFGCGIGRTYSGPVPALRIDYILADKSMKIQTHRIFENYWSDHFAVMSDLSF